MANILFTKELQRRLDGTGVEAFALHPGVIATNLLRHQNSILKVVLLPLIYLFGKSPANGALTSIYAATSPELKGKGGAYLSDSKIATPDPYADDPEVAKRLWDVSAELVHKFF